MTLDGRLGDYAIKPLTEPNDKFSPLGLCGIYMSVLSREVVMVSIY